MREDFACAVLRIVAVVIVAVGLCLMLVSAIWLWGVDGLLGGGPGAGLARPGVLQVGGAWILAHASIVAVGVLLFFVSPVLARQVVRQDR